MELCYISTSVSSIPKDIQNIACQFQYPTRISGSGSNVQCRVDRETLLSRRGIATTVEKYLGPTLLHLNIEGLTASKISIIEQLDNKNKTVVVLIQKTHCTNVNRMVLPFFSLVGSMLRRKHSLATFVHEQLS